MKRIFSLAALLLAFGYAMAQDVIVKKDGTIMNVYNLEESDNYYFFTLEPSADAATQKIGKGDVFSVKKNGESSKPQSGAGTQTATTVATTVAANNNVQKKANEHEPVTAKISSSVITQKKDGLYFSARTPDGHELNYLILSQEALTVAVTKGEYHESMYIIPEYVQVDDKTYTVTEIGKEAFLKENTVVEVQFPTTLKKIGKNAFSFSRLDKIILPEGLETLDDGAFASTGWSAWTGGRPVSEIYIPSSIKHIGAYCFIRCGTSISYRGFCQAYFSNMPDFITEGNCLGYGIDEEAVRAFQNRRR